MQGFERQGENHRQTAPPKARLTLRGTSFKASGPAPSGTAATEFVMSFKPALVRILATSSGARGTAAGSAAFESAARRILRSLRKQPSPPHTRNPGLVPHTLLGRGCRTNRERRWLKREARSRARPGPGSKFRPPADRNSGQDGTWWTRRYDCRPCRSAGPASGRQVGDCSRRPRRPRPEARGRQQEWSGGRRASFRNSSSASSQACCGLVTRDGLTLLCPRERLSCLIYEFVEFILPNCRQNGRSCR